MREPLPPPPQDWYRTYTRFALDLSTPPGCIATKRRDAAKVRSSRSVMTVVTRLSIAALVVAAVNQSCQRADREQQVQSTIVATSTDRTVRLRQVGSGAECLVDGKSGPASYLVSDLGRAGVPPLSAHEKAEIAAIRRFNHSRTLRFAFVGGTFVIFDAVEGPCEPYAPGYPVLNSGCNARYSPTDDFEHISAVPDCSQSPRPWMSAPAFREKPYASSQLHG